MRSRSIAGKGRGCAVDGCQRATKHAFCRHHWQRLPRKVRRALSRTRGSRGPEREAARHAADNLFNWRAARWNVGVQRSYRHHTTVDGGATVRLALVSAHWMTRPWFGVGVAFPGVVVVESVRINASEYLVGPAHAPTGLTLDRVPPMVGVEATVRNAGTEPLTVHVSLLGMSFEPARGPMDWRIVLVSWVRVRKPWTEGRKRRRLTAPSLPGSFFLHHAGDVAGVSYPITPASSRTQDRA